MNNSKVIFAAVQDEGRGAADAYNRRTARDAEIGYNSYKTKKAQNEANGNAGGMYAAAAALSENDTPAELLTKTLRRLNNEQAAHENNKPYKTKKAEYYKAAYIEGIKDILGLICNEITENHNEPQTQKLKDQAAAIVEVIGRRYNDKY